MASLAISARNLVKWFGEGAATTIAINDASFDAYFGETLFIVGPSISGQTFYTFILENLEKFGALKAIGEKGREVIYMILFQTTFTALTGYGIGVGVGLCTLLIGLAKFRLPDYASLITFGNLGLAFGMFVLIAGISSYIGICKVLKIEPFDIFLG